MTGAGALAETPVANELQAIQPPAQAAATLRIASPRDTAWCYVEKLREGLDPMRETVFSSKKKYTQLL